nr:erythromycin esterase family protein [Catelliglobosispora koreensis]
MSLMPLAEHIGKARIVMLGEASHGTHDYYAIRAQITRMLIAEHGFSFVAVEGDWPDCDRVNQAVLGGGDTDAALHAFARWPTWMWANSEVAAFCRWLRHWNETRPRSARVGFHGLDVYSLWESLQVITDYVRAHEPDSLDAVWDAYRCFEPYHEDPQEYAMSTRLVPRSCETEVMRLLVQARQRETSFDVWQNANVVADAERYYRAMVQGGPDSWNIRDTHMMETIDRLLEHYGSKAKAVIWAHNTHVGDAGATDMAAAGMVNIGQLARERYGRENVVLVGFGSHRGTVIAAPRWGSPWQNMTVPPAQSGSLEDLLRFHLPARTLMVFPRHGQPRWLTETCRHRAIGVVYHPESEGRSNYVPTRLGQRYDAFVWCEQTTSVHPLHTQPAHGEWETYPSGV